MSTTTSLRSPRPSRNVRAYRDDFERVSQRNTRNAGVSNSISDNQSLFNVSVYSFYFAPTPYGLRSPNLEHGSGSNKEHALAELVAIRSVNPLLFQATHAEKLCVAAYHPKIFSNPEYLELIYGTAGAESKGEFFPDVSIRVERPTANKEPAITSGKPYIVNHRKHPIPRKKVSENDHPLGQPQEARTRVLQSIPRVPLFSPPPPQAPIVIDHKRKGVSPNDVLHIHYCGKQAVLRINGIAEVFEMGNPRSPLQQALFIAQTAGYADHERVETGLEAQPHSMQFTKLTADSYEKVNLTLEWFRNCCEYARSIEICFPSAVEGWLWETAMQQQCNEFYYFYIHEHCSYGTPLPPRLDLRPVQICPRSIRLDQYLVPRHEWRLEHKGEPDDLELILIRGPYETLSTSLRKQARLGQYVHVSDPHEHILFQAPRGNSDLERWRTRNLTEDGALFRYSRRNIAPSLVQYDDIDHVALFQSNRCRRYFPRLHPNLYSTHH